MSLTCPALVQRYPTFFQKIDVTLTFVDLWPTRAGDRELGHFLLWRWASTNLSLKQRQKDDRQKPQQGIKKTYICTRGGPLAKFSGLKWPTTGLGCRYRIILYVQ